MDGRRRAERPVAAAPAAAAEAGSGSGLIDAGAIGTLRHISWSSIGSGLRHQPFRRLFDRDQAGGWIGAYGSHAIDALRCFFADEIVDRGGVMRTKIGRRRDRAGVEHASTAEDACSGRFAQANGGAVSTDTAFSTPVTLPQHIQLLGSEGAIEIVDDRQVTLRRAGREAEEFGFTPPAGNPHEPGLVPWLAAVRDAVRDGRQVAPSFEDGLAVARTIDRLRTTMVKLGPEPVLVPHDVG